MRSFAFRKFEYNRFFFRPSSGYGRLPPFVSPVGFLDIFGEAGRHNHYLQSFGTVDHQLELHVRALALSIELVKCSPCLPLPHPVSIILCSCIPLPFETLPVVFTWLP